MKTIHLSYGSRLKAGNDKTYSPSEKLVRKVPFSRGRRVRDEGFSVEKNRLKVDIIIE
jgi:hypothetical protein